MAFSPWSIPTLMCWTAGSMLDITVSPAHSKGQCGPLIKHVSMSSLTVARLANGFISSKRPGTWPPRALALDLAAKSPGFGPGRQEPW
eukprot:676193-Pelagomonas_calceolata.AAC.1